MKCPVPDCKAKDAVEALAARTQYLEAKLLSLESILKDIRNLIITLKDRHD